MDNTKECIKKTNYNPVEEAYKILVKLYHSDVKLPSEIEDAIGYLGEALE